MKLSDLERLSLANQFRIRAATEGDNRLLHYAEILEQGHESLYDLLFQSIAEPKPRMVGDDVKDILVMFLALEASYDEGAKPPRSAMFPKFLGFEKTDPHFLRGRPLVIFLFVEANLTRYSTFHPRCSKLRALNDQNCLARPDLPDQPCSNGGYKGRN